MKPEKNLKIAQNPQRPVQAVLARSLFLKADAHRAVEEEDVLFESVEAAAVGKFAIHLAS